MKMINKFKNNKNNNIGITLIALVITIIVLLILAGITVAQLSGNNGIFSRTNTAKQKYSNAQEYEEDVILKTSNMVDSITTGNARDVKFHKYSSTPEVVGEWLDGKTVYAKTIQINSLTQNAWTSTNHNIANLDKIIEMGGAIYLCRDGTTNYGWYTIPGEINTSLASSILLSASESVFSIYMGDFFKYDSNCYGYVTIYYTTK